MGKTTIDDPHMDVDYCGVANLVDRLRKYAFRMDEVPKLTDT